MGAGGVPVRTFLIADIRGYTRFTQEHGDEAAAWLASTFAEIVSAAAAEHHGELVELRGDEALVAFDSARQALRAAVDVQRRCRVQGELGPVLPLGVGIGLDSGEAVPLDGGGYRGGALNLAARLCSLAAAGEILASEGVVHLARHVDGLRFAPRRPERLKGLAQRVRVVEVVPTEPLPPVPKLPPARRMSRRKMGTVGAALLAAAAAALAIVLTRSGEGATAGLRADTAGLLQTNGRLVGQVPVAGRPAGIAVGDGAVWISDAVNDTLLRVDPRKMLVVDRIHVGADPAEVAIGGGSVWVANSDDGTVSQINPTTDSVVARIRVGNGPTSVAFGAGRVWVLNVVDATVTAISPPTGHTTVIPLGQNPTQLVFGLGSVWVTSEEAGVLLRLDPRAGRVEQATPVGNGPDGLATGDGAVWVANAPDQTISRVDPGSGAVSKIALSGRPDEVAVAGGDVWAADTLDGSVSVIDATTRRVRRTIATHEDPTALAATQGRVWALALASSAAHRGGTLRIVSQGGDTFDSIDPGAAFRVATWQFLAMVYDGLVTYRRAGGPSGQTVVPDLADGLPIVEDGGRTYVFRLRSGVRYANGKPVRAHDFRAALEREYRAHVGLAFEEQLPGSDRCSKGSCDLSKSVVTDDRAGTITFHLQAPDPDFLFKLALPYGDAVPARAPAIGSGRRALPGTGPYRIVRFVPNHLLVLTRNRYFQEWSQDAQPDGYPDRIVYRFGLDPGAETTAVERGRADVMLDSPPVDRLREIATRYPSQAHVFVEPTVFYLFLNTRIAPFDDVRVRRALNLATDRGKLVRLWGGTQLARPTCQVLPPGIAGYRPYCPYTRGASAAGNWTGPALDRARALIRAAGGGHGSVRLLARGDPTNIALAHYFAGLLERLGYRVRLRLYDDPERFYEAAGRPSTRAGAGLQGWESNFPRASDFFPSLLTCSSYQPEAHVNVNAAGFCDRRVDPEIERAQTLAATDPAASAALWSRVDRRVTDEAPWVAFLNRAGVDLTSQRVGNYQRNQQFSVLLDQLWVR